MPFFTKKDHTDKREDHRNWLLSELQKLRGQGLWRGSFFQIPKKDLIRFPLEEQSSRYQVKEEIHLHIRSDFAEIFADATHSDFKLRMKDYLDDPANFVKQLAQSIRQRSYIRTHKDKADYRKKV